MVQNMTTGNPVKLIVTFAIPLMIASIFQQLYNVADIILVGRLIGLKALAAVGASAPIYFTLMMITLGFTGGLTVITAQRFGAHDKEGVRKSVVHCIIASTVLSFTITLLLHFNMLNILRLMNVPEEIISDAYHFIIVLSSGLVMIVFYNLLSFFMRALGDSRTPLYFLIFSSILNIVLNIYLIYYLNFGVIGSATGTLIAIAVSVMACILYIRKKFPLLHVRRQDWKFDPQFMWQHLRIAIPMSLQFSVIAAGLLIIQAVCNSFGPDVIAAFTSVLRLEQVATQPLVATGMAIATYTAQNFGAGKIGRIRKGVLWASVISISFSLFIALLMRFTGKDLVGMFMKAQNEGVLQIASGYLHISTLFYLFLGQIFIFRNALQGMGRAQIPLLASFIELVARSVAAIYLAHKIGYSGIYYASPIAWLGAALVVAIGYFMTIRKLRKRFWYAHLKWSVRPDSHQLPILCGSGRAAQVLSAGE